MGKTSGRGAGPGDGQDRFDELLGSVAVRVDRALDGFLPPADEPPQRLHAAMRYGALSPGKRLRPFIVLASAAAFGLPEERAMPAACALECVHAYSLIHDDLPAMDDDDYRRGRPSCHRAFDEATAILAGDALLTLAFSLLAGAVGEGIGPGAVLAAAAELSDAAGSRGMVGGQSLEFERPAPAEADLLEIHARKTGALFRAAAVIGGRLAGAGEPDLAALRGFGEAFGSAYQIVDDLHDVDQDKARGTGVLPITGRDGAALRARRFLVAAEARLKGLKAAGRPVGPLLSLTDWLGRGLL